MPQTQTSRWKAAVFTALSRMERVLRGCPIATPDEFKKVRNFLVLQQEAPLGSVVHATPFFEALKRALPDAHITVAASSMAVSALGHNPYIDRCVVTPDPFLNFTQAVGAVRQLLRSMPSGPRCIVTMVGNQRTRVAILGVLAGSATRAGYTLAPELYDAPLRFHPDRGQIESNLDILRTLGHPVAFCEPRIFFTQEDAVYAAGLLEAIARFPAAPRIAMVTQNSGGQRNQWSAERFRQVVANLSQTLGAVPIFLGTVNDAAAIELLRQYLPNPGISLAGKTTIPQLAAVLAQCDLAISLDTGTFHVARAVGLPGVVIAPAWQSALEWLPVGHPRYRVLQGPSLAAPPPSDYWIEEVSVEQVSAAAMELLALFPAAPAQRVLRLQGSLRSLL